MDFLDSLDTKTKENKSSRVRSWYLYEQFKSLERNQLDAAQKLKDRSNQDRILRQELSERRARRKLYDECGLCHSESCIEDSASERNKTSLNASIDDFFESFCELHDERSSQGTDRDTDMEDSNSQDDSQTRKRYSDDFKSLEDIKDNHSFADSANSVVKKEEKKGPNYVQYVREEMKFGKKNIAEEINMQLDTVNENINCLKKYYKLCSEDKISEVDSSESFREDFYKSVSTRDRHENDINLYTMWSKLVSFAYQLIKLNHGNCYYDYGSQFLTAVLACDVLRKGVNKMCHILQPYVSPIKFATDESETSTTSLKKTKRKKPLTAKKSKKSLQHKTPSSGQSNYKARLRNKYTSDDYGRNSPDSFGYKNIAKYRCSEPCHCEAKISTCKGELREKSSCSLWASISDATCRCPRHVKVTNPMLKIGQYIDRILSDIDDC